MRGRGVFLEGQPRHSTRGQDTSTPQFGGYVCTLCRRTTKFDFLTYMGKMLVFMGSPRPTPRGQAPSLPNFGGSVIMPTPFNAELPNS